MQPLTTEWVDKAEGDFATLLREVRARKQPNYDSACFHAQQCAEKYLKAREQGGRMAYQSQLDFGGGRVFLLRAIVVDTVNPAVVVTVYRTSKISKDWRTTP